jgi:hypothetical protein
LVFPGFLYWFNIYSQIKNNFQKMTSELKNIILKIAKQFNLEPAALAAFVEVETGGLGFDTSTGKIMIQFEPVWMKKLAPYAPSGKWSLNKVERQSAEWLAFNDAYSKNSEGAMKSTSIGLGQIMGFHFKRLGFSSVGEMWDHAKKSLDNQVWQICKFIETDNKLKFALKTGDFFTVAKIYNGAGFLALARKYGREPYNISLAKAYGKYKAIFT